jgi:hypothetical protein
MGDSIVLMNEKRIIKDCFINKVHPAIGLAFQLHCYVAMWLWVCCCSAVILLL